jgi:hypothetical protein
MDPRSNSRRWIIKFGLTAPVALASGCSGTDGSSFVAGAQPARTSPAQVTTPQQTSPLFLKGYTRQQVVQPDNPSALDLLGLNRPQSADRQGQARLTQAALLPVPTLNESLRLQEVFRNLIAMTSDEFGLAMMIDGQSDERRICEFVQAKMPRHARRS